MSLSDDELRELKKERDLLLAACRAMRKAQRFRSIDPLSQTGSKIGKAQLQMDAAIKAAEEDREQ